MLTEKWKRWFERNKAEREKYAPLDADEASWPRNQPMPAIQMIDVARLEAEEVAAEAELAACRMVRSHNFQIWMVD